MAHKVLVINGSPHETGCTARALEEVIKTLHEEGIETELLQIGKKDIPGCRACGFCMRTGKCVINDIVNEAALKFEEADGLIIGSPVYFGYPTGQVRSLVERLLFPLDTYLFDDQGNRLKVPHKPVQTALIYTMNCPEDLSHKIGYDTLLGFTGEEMGRLYGYNEILCSFETLQFKDYSRYDMNLFSEEQRKERHETQFPVDLRNAYDLGKRLTEKAKEISA